jgi:hypothetical protein
MRKTRIFPCVRLSKPQAAERAELLRHDLVTELGAELLTGLGAAEPHFDLVLGGLIVLDDPLLDLDLGEPALPGGR